MEPRRLTFHHYKSALHRDVGLGFSSSLRDTVKVCTTWIDKITSKRQLAPQKIIYFSTHGGAHHPISQETARLLVTALAVAMVTVNSHTSHVIFRLLPESVSCQGLSGLIFTGSNLSSMWKWCGCTKSERVMGWQWASYWLCRHL